MEKRRCPFCAGIITPLGCPSQKCPRFNRSLTPTETSEGTPQEEMSRFQAALAEKDAEIQRLYEYIKRLEASRAR